MKGPIWIVVAEGRGRFPRSYSVLIQDRGGRTLIDTGCGVEVLRSLRERVAIDQVINTHTHPDHSAGNFLFADLEILVPEPGEATSGDLVALSERFFDDAELRLIWREFIGERLGFIDQRPSATFAVDDELRLGETVVQVIHAPGHTVDHCCFHVPDHDLLISADIDLTSFGPWYGHPESDLDVFRAAIRRVADLEPLVVVSSHRPPVKRDISAAFQSFERIIDAREARLLDFLDEERTADEITDRAVIYGRFPYIPPVTRYWESQMIGKHLDELIEGGTVRRTERGFIRTP